MAKTTLKKHPVLEGMGSLIHSDGIGFRVWAANAEKVAVVGDFNDWKPQALALEGEGIWYGFVPGAVTGQEYLYEIGLGEGQVSRIDPYARMLTHSSGNGIIYDPNEFDWGDDQRLELNRSDLVIYEMHLGTFAGSFEQAIERLAYLEALGINAIELMPVTDFPGELSWGYNPAHLFAVETNYGGADGLKAFVKAAHQRGIAVILDVVYNHLGPDDLCLWNFDGSDPDGPGPYFYSDERAETPWGHTRPNYGSQPVRQLLRDNALMWIQEYHIDGIRGDGTVYIRRDRSEHEGGCELPDGWSLLQWINDELHALSPPAMMIAEDLQNNEWLTKPTQDGGAGFDAQWDGRMTGSLRDMLSSNEDSDRSPSEVAELLQARFNGDAFQSVLFTESHDAVANGKSRVPQEIDPENPDSYWAKARSSLGAFVVLTCPGIPMLFQGQARFDDGWFRDDQPIDWSAQGRDRDLLHLYRDLIVLRTGRDPAAPGLNGYGLEIVGVHEDEGWLAYRRFHPDSDHPGSLVIVQMKSQACQVRLTGIRDGRWLSRFDSGSMENRDGSPETSTAVECQQGEFVTDVAGYSVIVFSPE